VNHAMALFALVGALSAAGVVHLHSSTAKSVGNPPGWMRMDSGTNLPEVASHRSRLVISYCGQCHAPPPPELHSSEEWRWLIVQMDMRSWPTNRPDVRVASNEDLMEIAKYYEAYSAK